MDLQFKLVGVAKGHSVSKAVEKHASILDYEQDVLKAPPYFKGMSALCAVCVCVCTSRHVRYVRVCVCVLCECV